MKIQSTFQADIVGIQIKRNHSHDGREATLDIDVGVDHQQCPAKFGDDFTALAFATMKIHEPTNDVDTQRWEFLQDSIKPGKAIVCEHHDVAIDGNTIRCQPDIQTVKPVDGKPSVVVRIRLTLEATMAKALVDKVGDTLKVEFAPRQGELDFEAAKGAA